MMNKLKFNSQICTTKEQSQRLLELGLKPETADMIYMQIDGTWICVISQFDDEYVPYEDHFPAWSLHRLLCLLYPREDVYPIMPSTAYDDIIDEIEDEIKCGGFNKEYLKQ
jgi:hypothetical protein